MFLIRNGIKQKYQLGAGVVIRGCVPILDLADLGRRDIDLFCYFAGRQSSLLQRPDDGWKIRLPHTRILGKPECAVKHTR